MTKFITLFLIMTFEYGCNEPKKSKINSIENTTELNNQKHNDENTDSLRASIKPDNREDFNFFWEKFRNAVLSNDSNLLKKLTSFPLNCKGMSDEDPSIKISMDQFNKIFSMFLNQWDGLSLDGKTELELIKKSEKSNENVIENSFREGDMIFLKKYGIWKLSTLYLSDEIYNTLK